MTKRAKFILVGLPAALVGYLSIGFAVRWPPSDPDWIKGPVKSVVWENVLVDKRDGQLLEGSRWGRRTAEYDLRGYLIKETIAGDMCGFTCSAMFRYLRVAFWPLTLQRNGSSSYDSAGKLIQVERDYSSTGKWRTRYEYDAKGNWIKKTGLLQDSKFFEGDSSFIPREIEYRTILYYE